jgi:hypothetical protein
MWVTVCRHRGSSSDERQVIGAQQLSQSLSPDAQLRADAEAFYSGPWRAGIRERYGMDPQIKYFHTACVTDNAAGAVLLPDAE